MKIIRLLLLLFLSLFVVQNINAGEEFRLVVNNRTIIVPQPKGLVLSASDSGNLVQGAVDLCDKSKVVIPVANFYQEDRTGGYRDFGVRIRIVNSTSPTGFTLDDIEALRKTQVERCDDNYTKMCLDGLAKRGLDRDRKMNVEFASCRPQTQAVTSFYTHSTGYYKSNAKKYDSYTLVSTVLIDGIMFSVSFWRDYVSCEEIEKYAEKYIADFFRVNSVPGSVSQQPGNKAVEQRRGVDNNKNLLATLELLGGEFKTFASAGLKEAKGLNFTIEYPAIFSHYYDSSRSLQKFEDSKNNGVYKYAFILAVNYLPNNNEKLQMSANEWAEFNSELYYSVPDKTFSSYQAATIERERTTFNGNPAVVLNITNAGEVADRNIKVNCRIITVFYSHYYVSLRFIYTYNAQQLSDLEAKTIYSYCDLQRYMVASIKFSGTE